MRKSEFIVLVVLLLSIWGLVLVDFVRSDVLRHSDTKNDSRGLQCVYNCGYFNEVLRLQPTTQVQATMRIQATVQVQKTQSSARLHRLSDGVEMRPLEMLRSGKL